MSEQFKNKLFKDLILNRSKSVEIDLFPLLSNFEYKTKIDLNKIPENIDIPENFNSSGISSKITK